ncbi:oligoendopeptidase F [Selenomonadales bacterium 4137-cl]|uniref:Oligopeptidase F n=2 Tax=Anaeroselena agilis TaxID=3063788 RepID=A0ABU3NUG5_9FIRM|nr:oligoendopeptidase F [Selenomonadales bacterium 4137-cl]
MRILAMAILPFFLGTMLLSSTTVEAGPPAGGKVPERSEISAEFKWRLTDIYADESSWQADFEKLKAQLPEITQFRGKLGNAASDLAACLKKRDEIGVTAGKLYAYARMHRDENTADAKYQGMTGKIETLLAEAGAATAYIEPEILAIPEAKLADYRKQEPGLKDYSFYFDNLLRQKKHVLSPAEEEILSRSTEATSAAENAFNMLAHADMRFPEVTDEDGKKVQLSEGRYRSFIMSPDRNVREEAFKGLFDTYNQYRNTFAATLGGNVKKNIFYAKTRKYKTTLESSLEADNVPQAVYDNLITTVHANLGPLHRYVALKKKALAVDEMHMYDLYTPLIRDVKLTYEYDEALKVIHTALAPLGPEYAGILDKSFTSGWMDVYENKGKQTGAYSWGVYGAHPFVLLNYHNRYDDVSTIAHELGHAIHSYYSHKSQPYATSQYTTFTAEVASTTNEILLIDHMLKTTTDKRVRLYLINQYLEAVRATVYRQTMFAEFEKMIYAKAEEGETLTADLLDAMWQELNEKYYGPDIVVDKEINVEWARIPHFYWDFYVYQYVTGYAAATALAEQIQKEGHPAQQRYINFLKSGGSDYSIEILKRAGVDMSTPKPIEVTLQKFSSLLDELEKILSES